MSGSLIIAVALVLKLLPCAHFIAPPPHHTLSCPQGIQPAVVVLAIATAAAVGAVGYAIYRYISLP